MDSTTILVVEDNSRWRELLKTLLGRTYLVEEASNLADAEVRLRDRRFQLVITNLQLGAFADIADEMGLLVIETLQEIAPGTPCIVLTGSDAKKQGQVQHYCSTRYEAPVTVMGKGSENLYRELRGKVTDLLGYRHSPLSMSIA